ncbi:uncharacterized protein LOC18434349 [Amborella trichopoda]|uniref:J domain-containing protein n=1 Tax=Amborella trichopoda TaxID=13333 RepID=W1PEQ7_AMBTC|nr:uncharacterized protein LOC18434349 [Amborella trichopoda]ERN06159.1 hypothetical protein AMTR_s00016p00110380 [Amborella trichopoda]|eukprot:XP_006844484.1 uncharacterized protein LOC18434349 [Amborella trichopoda]
MECNKEEALRARNIARKKIENEDYEGAKKMLIKARKLFPDVEDIEQLIEICNIFLASKIKTPSSDIDWYAILQLPYNADQDSIESQYERFAILLAPDKDRYPRAEPALQLLDEAFAVLSDRERRFAYDLRNLIRNDSLAEQQRGSLSGHDDSHDWGREGNTKQKRKVNETPNGPAFVLGLPIPSQKKSKISSANGGTVVKSHVPKIELEEREAHGTARESGSSLHGLKELPDASQDDGLQRQAYTHGVNQMGVPSLSWDPSKGEAANACVGAEIASTSSQHEHNDPEVDFFGFEKNRSIGLFAKDQVWATYDEHGMPRCYARIDQVLSSNFKLRVAWLEPSFLPGWDMRWKYKSVGFPDGCGIFRIGKKAVVDNHYIFSHILFSCEKNEQSRTYNVYPRKGDVWAIYKDWNVTKQYHYLGSPRRHVFQIVEILEDYDHALGSRVAYLIKVEGFRSLFRRHTSDGVDVVIQIPPTELPRISHQIPAFKTSGDGNGSTPEECLELDSCSLPPVIDDFTNRVDPNTNFCLYTKFLDVKGYGWRDDFGPDQLWAAYDDYDGMPRYYARVNRKLSSDFTVCVTWLEPDPISEEEKRWYRAGLPVACGNFRLKKSTITRQHLMFSHQLTWQLGISGVHFTIYPKIGDVWAVYKYWHIRWSSGLWRPKEFEYDMVEVLTNYSRDRGVKVVRLVKVEGHKGVFQRQKDDGVEASFHIMGNELLKFSHQVPAFKIRRGLASALPEGSMVLDPLSIPNCVINELDPSSLEKIKEMCEEGGAGIQTKGVTDMRGVQTSDKIENDRVQREREEVNRVVGFLANPLPPPSPSLDIYDHLNSEFHDFKSIRLLDNFSLDQVWAIYDGSDRMPRSYARVKEIIPVDLKVQVTQLKPHPTLEDEMVWVEESLPMACGIFREGKSVVTKSVLDFSHLVSCDWSSPKSFFKILPKKGEVWALYKRWNLGWKHIDLENSDYQMVEILSDFTEKSSMAVACLIEVEGFRSIFQRHVHEGFELVRKLSRNELMCFSHQVPAFRVKGEEREGIPEGCLELDPASMPVHGIISYDVR